jgi:hypothetical protein
MSEFRIQAIINTHETVTRATPDKAFDVNNSTVLINEDEVIAEENRLNAEFTANEYSRNRKAEYPDWGTQLNKIYDDGLTKWKTEMVDPVKAKYPKPA